MQILRRWAWIAVLIIPSSSQACDICGCGGGAYSANLFPLLQQHYLSVGLQSLTYHTEAHGGELSSSEVFRTMEFGGRWQLHPRIQLGGKLPWHLNSRQYSDQANQQLTGLGDLSLEFWFAVIDPRKQVGRNFTHSLQIGTGVKLPTGDHKRLDHTGTLYHPNLQPGTGSTDLLFSSLYALRHNNWGVSAEGSLQRKGSNNIGFQFGQQWTAAITSFYNFKLGKSNLTPLLGISHQQRQEDYEDGEILFESGGKAMYGMAGITCFFGRTAFSALVQTPLKSHLAQGHVTPGMPLQCAATLVLGKKKQKSISITVPQVFPDVQKN